MFGFFLIKNSYWNYFLSSLMRKGDLIFRIFKIKTDRAQNLIDEFLANFEYQKTFL